MLSRIAAIALLGALLTGTAARAGDAQAAPPAAVTQGFTTFLQDVLAGKVPPNISSTMRSQSSAMFSGVKAAFGPLGAFRKLIFVRQDTLQGYRRYHYTAVFEKDVQHVIFVTDSNGTIVGFFEDQPSSPGP